MSKDIEQIRQVIMKILFEEYELETLELDDELRSEIYEKIKKVQEEYGLSHEEMEDVMDSI